MTEPNTNQLRAEREQDVSLRDIYRYRQLQSDRVPPYYMRRNSKRKRLQCNKPVCHNIACEAQENIVKPSNARTIQFKKRTTSETGNGKSFL